MQRLASGAHSFEYSWGSSWYASSRFALEKRRTIRVDQLPEQNRSRSRATWRK